MSSRIPPRGQPPAPQVADLTRVRPAPVVISVVLAAVAVLATLVMPGALAGSPQTVWPVNGSVLSEFDPPDPDWLPGHRGLDLAAAPRQEVRTPRAGIMEFAGTVAGVPVVVVAHGAARATYQPATATVPTGWPVATGDVIATVSGTGGHCAGRCMHWGLRIGGRYADPRLLLGRFEAVLLPSDP